jgi:S-adenosylmethionine synthetase
MRSHFGLYRRSFPERRLAQPRGRRIFGHTNRIVIAGEVRGPASITPKEMETAAREAVHEIGYAQKGFHWQWADVQIYVHAQSTTSRWALTRMLTRTKGLCDQGIMFGYAATRRRASARAS